MAPSSTPKTVVNVADRLAIMARLQPTAWAVVDESTREKQEKRITFAQLDREATCLAQGLLAMGVVPGTRLALLVPPGVAMVKLVFGLLRSGATTVLIDPGMGRRHLIACLARTNPQGFVAISPVQAIRQLLRHRFPQAKLNVTVGRRWFWGGFTEQELLSQGELTQAPLPATTADDPAAIIYTSGSTGPPKGVLYTHQMFDTQAEQIQQQYGIEPGGIDLACFALFGLFNSAMGVTTIFPEMDFSRPASADPEKLLRAANQWKITQAFASPAVWDSLSRYCLDNNRQIPTLRKILSCGAPVPADVLRRTLACAHPEAEMHTPYGATECLPVATIEAQVVLGETAAQTVQGAGICVGRKFACGQWRVIRMTDDPIPNIETSETLPTGEVGELIVCGPQVSSAYLGIEQRAEESARHDKTRTLTADDNAQAKIQDGDTIWHRVGDVGYFDDRQRFWYCGRKAHRVTMTTGTLYSICCEAIFNQHPLVRRSALVGVGLPGAQRPLLVVETVRDKQDLKPPVEAPSDDWKKLVAQLKQLGQQQLASQAIDDFLWHPSLPVDVRHNAKINREQLAIWAAKQLA